MANPKNEGEHNINKASFVNINLGENRYFFYEKKAETIGERDPRNLQNNI